MWYPLVYVFGCGHRPPVLFCLHIQAQVVQGIVKVIQCHHHLQVLAGSRRQVGPTWRLLISWAHRPLATPTCRKLCQWWGVCRRLPRPSDALCWRPPAVRFLFSPSSSLLSWFTFPGITLQAHLFLHCPTHPSLCCPLSPFPASPLRSMLSITGGRISPTPASLPRALSPRPLLPTTLGRGSPSRDLELGEDLIWSHNSIRRGISDSTLPGCVPNGTLGSSS